MLATQSKKFEQELLNLINNCGLSVTEAYYIVENAALQLKEIYNGLLLKEQASDFIQHQTSDVSIENENEQLNTTDEAVGEILE